MGKGGVTSPTTTLLHGVPVFRCEELRARLSAPQCAENWRAVNEDSGRPKRAMSLVGRQIGLGSCRGCSVGRRNDRKHKRKGWTDDKE